MMQDYWRRVCASLDDQAPITFHFVALSLLPSSPPFLDAFVRTLQDRAARWTNTSSCRETFLHDKGKGKWITSPNNSKSSLKPTISAPKELSSHSCVYKGHIQAHCWRMKRNNATKPSPTNPKLTPRSETWHTTKETFFLGINTNSSSIRKLLEICQFLRLHAWAMYFLIHLSVNLLSVSSIME